MLAGSAICSPPAALSFSRPSAGVGSVMVAAVTAKDEKATPPHSRCPNSENHTFMMLWQFWPKARREMLSLRAAARQSLSSSRRSLSSPTRSLTSQRKQSFFDWWRENVVKPIHGTKILLPDIAGIPAHQYMQFVYPWPVIVGGYYIMQWAIGRSHDSIGEAGEKLRDRDGFKQHDTVESQRAALQKILDDAKRRKG